MDRGLRRTISIHAPCEGSDPAVSIEHGRKSSISIHAPCEGSDLLLGGVFLCSMRFQSTLPVRGATLGYVPAHG